MFDSFEVKSYNQLLFRLGLANFFFTFLLFIFAYELALTEPHKVAITQTLETLRIHPVLSRISVLAVFSAFWGWLSTVVLRLHDRVHEPCLRRWRAAYDADLILRSLCYEQYSSISPDLFERAYTDKRICRKLMQRLFYTFVGDCTPQHEGSRTFFYTVMWKYWSAALCDLYCTVGILLLASYHTITATRMSPFLVAGVSIAILASRVISNSFLDEAHEITLNQVHSIRTHNKAEFEEELKTVAQELSAWRE